MRVTVLVTAALALTGCASQQRDDRPPPDPGLACIEQLAARQELAPLAAKVALGLAKDQPFSLMTRTDKPTEQDQQLIAAWVNERQECFRMSDAWTKQYNAPPQIIAIRGEAFSRFLAASADLHAGKLTYGEYANVRAQLNAEGERQTSNVVQRLHEQEAMAAEQRRNRAMMYLLNQPSFQPRPAYQPSRPTTTNCYRFGSQVNCTTY